MSAVQIVAAHASKMLTEGSGLRRVELISTAEDSGHMMPLPPHSLSLVCSIGRECTLVVNTELSGGATSHLDLATWPDCQKLSEGPSFSEDVSCLVQHHFYCWSWHALNICSPFPAVLRCLNVQPLERKFHGHGSKPRDSEYLLGTQMPSISGAIQGDGNGELAAGHSTQALGAQLHKGFPHTMPL